MVSERSPETKEIVQSTGYTAIFRPDGIVQFNMTSLETTLDDVRSMTKTMFHFGEGKQLPVLIIGEPRGSLDPEAREYAASEEGGVYTKANAIVVNSIVNRIAANFFIQFSKPVRPTRMFNSEKNAVLWLQSFL